MDQSWIGLFKQFHYVFNKGVIFLASLSTITHPSPCENCCSTVGAGGIWIQVCHDIICMVQQLNFHAHQTLWYTNNWYNNIISEMKSGYSNAWHKSCVNCVSSIDFNKHYYAVLCMYNSYSTYIVITQRKQSLHAWFNSNLICGLRYMGENSLLGD